MARLSDLYRLEIRVRMRTSFTTTFHSRLYMHKLYKSSSFTEFICDEIGHHLMVAESMFLVPLKQND